MTEGVLAQRAWALRQAQLQALFDRIPGALSLRDLNGHHAVELRKPRIHRAERRSRFREFGIRAPSIGDRPVDVHAGVPEVVPGVLARKDPWIGTAIIHAATDRDRQRQSR